MCLVLSTKFDCDLRGDSMLYGKSLCCFFGLALVGKDIVFRFIIDHSSLFWECPSLWALPNVKIGELYFLLKN